MAITAFGRDGVRSQGVPTAVRSATFVRRESIMIRIRIAVLAVAGGLVGALPNGASAQLEDTPERRAACMADAIMLCPSAIPNRARIASCLAARKSQLSPQCRAQFASR